MSEERDVKTTGWVDPAAPGRAPATPGPRQGGATAVADPRGEVPAPVAPPAPDAAGGGAAPSPAGPPGPAAPAGEAPATVPTPAQQPTGAEQLTGGEPPTTAAQPGTHPTAPVTVRPRPRVPSREQMIRMGPWAPVAGAALGLLLGIVVVLLLAPAVVSFEERLSLVFLVLGMTLLGAGGTLLADEVRLLRRGTQAVEARSSNAGAIAALLNGLTPARLLITVSAFALLLSAYVTSRN